jgi:hypothetical protein
MATNKRTRILTLIHGLAAEIPLAPHVKAENASIGMTRARIGTHCKNKECVGVVGKGDVCYHK